MKGVVMPANVGNVRQRDFQALFTEGNQFDPTIIGSAFTSDRSGGQHQRHGGQFQPR